MEEGTGADGAEDAVRRGAVPGWMVGLSYFNWRATLVVYVIPFVAVRFLMMAGNWGQHAFIDPARPENCYVNAITCVNTRYNRRCFNDGYHIGHHLKANRHWTEMPGEFEANIATYAKERAIVFEGIDFFIVWLFLMLGRFDWLAKHYVSLDGKKRDEGEIIALLKSRLVPIHRELKAGRASHTALGGARRADATDALDCPNRPDLRGRRLRARRKATPKSCFLRPVSARSPPTRRNGPSICRPWSPISSSGERATTRRTTFTPIPTIASACTSGARARTRRTRRSSSSRTRQWPSGRSGTQRTSRVTSSLPAAAAGDPLGNRAFWMPFGKAALAVFAQMLGTPPTALPELMGNWSRQTRAPQAYCSSMGRC